MEKLWRSWEPRVILPTFRGCDNIIDFSVNSSLNRSRGGIFYSLSYPIYNLYKKRNSFRTMLRHYRNMIFRSAIRYRCILLSREGEYLYQWKLEGRYREGDYFRVNINDVARQSGLEEVLEADNLIVVVASRGRNDTCMSSPGSITIKYINDKKISGFRTGLFSRVLNEGAAGHFGFTGVNPTVMLRRDVRSSILLVNHSSSSSYKKVVNPTIRLYRSPDEYLESGFGAIQPLGAREQALLDVFPEAEEFLAESSGSGCTVATVKGFSLASFHVFRDGRGELMAIDHSRPAHTNIIGR